MELDTLATIILCESTSDFLIVKFVLYFVLNLLIYSVLSC